MSSADVAMVDASDTYADEPAQDHLDYAWSSNGCAYDSGVPRTLQGTIIACLKPKTGPFPSPFRAPPIQPSSAELAPDMPVKALWIGMYVHAQKNKAKTLQAKAGAIAEMKDIEPIEKSDKALRVVVTTTSRRTTTYALIDQNSSGLCLPTVVSVDEVFFFRKFRDPDDAMTAVQHRGKAWSANVRALLPRSDDSLAKAKAKSEGPRVLSLPWGDAFAGDTTRSMAGYENTGSVEYLEDLTRQIKDRLKITEEDPNQSSVMMYKAFNTTSKPRFSDVSFQLLHGEILNHWPDLTDTLRITTSELATMYKAVTLAEVCVDPMFNRAFIVLLCEELRKLTPDQLADDDGLAAHTQDCLRMVERMFGCEGPPKHPKPRTNTADGNELCLQVIKETLVSVLKAARTFDKERLEKISPMSFGVTIEKLFDDIIMNGRDYDAVMFALKQARRLDLEDSLARNHIVFRKLDELVALLAKCSE